MADEQQGEMMELPDDQPLGMEEDGKGGTFVDMDSQTPAGESGFYDNLVTQMSRQTLDRISFDLYDRVKYDQTAKEKRDKKYAESLKRTGLGDEAPGGAQFQGASRTVHPMLTQASVEYEARAIKELMPASGPVKTAIYGTEASKARWNKAERKTRFLNWQLRVQISEFRPELEKILMQSSLSGVCYQRWTWEGKLRRPCAHAATSDKVLVPFAASSFYTAERITYIDDITEFDYKERVRTGMYVDAELVRSTMAPEQTKVQIAQEKIQGKTSNIYNEDGVRRTYEINCFLEGIEKEIGTTGDDIPPVLPYLVYLDESSKAVLAVVRNWEEQDTKYERMHWLIEWPFVPWDGVYPIGFMHMIGGLSAAATGALRALLDSAHVNNLPTALLLKGSSVGGQSKQVRAAETSEIDGGVGGDDIRKRAMPVPYNPPSEVLYQLLQFLVESGGGMVRVALDSLAQDNPNMPVGTMYAAIEQGLNVVSGILGRQYYSMEQTLKVLHRIDRMYITDEQIKSETGELLAYRADFQGPLDCIPVADPATPSDAHRHAKVQAVSQRSVVVPQLYNLNAVEKLFLTKMLGMSTEEADELLAPVPKAQEMNAANENSAATLGRPITAFPEQDHMAHLQTHVDFMKHPLFGSFILIAPKFLPIILDHLKEHLAMWYVTRVYERLQEALQEEPTQYQKSQDPEVRKELDKTIAMVSRDVLEEDVKKLQMLPPVIQQAMQLVQQFQQPQLDPQTQVQAQRNAIQGKKNDEDTQIRRADLQQRAQTANIRAVIDGKTLEQRTEHERLRAATQTAIADADRVAEQARLQLKEMGESERTSETNQTKLAANTDDNQTALAIAQAEIENSENIDLSTGSGINPGSNQ